MNENGTIEYLRVFEPIVGKKSKNWEQGSQVLLFDLIAFLCSVDSFRIWKHFATSVAQRLSLYSYILYIYFFKDTFT